jgi:Fic-DOC domain mobile mystery protein B
MNLEYPPGATPLDPDEVQGLIPSHLTLQRQLNDFEQANIIEATQWAFARKRGDPLQPDFVCTIHRRMFRSTWKWAGEFRRSDKNIGCRWIEVPMRLHQFLGDVSTQLEHRVYSSRELAARYHHRLVAIHVFPNGNGRHARIMADLLLKGLTGERFGWGGQDMAAPGEVRSNYIAALRAADAGDYGKLFAFLTVD